MNVKLRVKNIITTALTMTALVLVFAATLAYLSYALGHGFIVSSTTLIVLVMLIGTFKFLMSEPISSINEDLKLLTDEQIEAKNKFEAHIMAMTLSSMFINIVAILVVSAILKLF